MPPDHPMTPVFFYISGHGFGHAARQIEVINALGASHPGVDIVVRTSAPRWLFDRTVRVPFTFLPGPGDTGVAQIDSLRLDEEATIRTAAQFHRRLPSLVAQESALLRRHGARLVISDAPPLACAAAAAAGVPAIVVANFTWDWIYEGYPAALASAPELIPLIQDAYACAEAAWRLPLHGGFAPFNASRTVTDVPFIARHATRSRADARRRLDLPAGVPLALSSFGGYGIESFEPARLDCLAHFSVVLTGRAAPGLLPSGVYFVHESELYATGLRYEDLVGAVDVVVTKPGFGIIAECLANHTAMLYTSRGPFREYDVMVAEMPRLLQCEFIEQDALLAGRWRAPLEHLMQKPAPRERPATNGAEVVAGMITVRLSV